VCQWTLRVLQTTQQGQHFPLNSRRGSFVYISVLLPITLHPLPFFSPCCPASFLYIGFSKDLPSAILHKSCQVLRDCTFSTMHRSSPLGYELFSRWLPKRSKESPSINYDLASPNTYCHLSVNCEMVEGESEDSLVGWNIKRSAWIYSHVSWYLLP
jgi:hypothetical protein